MSDSLDWSGFSEEDPDQDGNRGTDRNANPPVDGKPDTDRNKNRDPDPYELARAIVLRQLNAAPKSRLQLARKLAEREVPPDVAMAVLDRFEEVKLIDDREFAGLWVRSRTQTRALAKGALRRELAAKGITGDLAEEALDQVSEEDEQQRARALVRKKLRTAGDVSDRVGRDKFVRRTASMLARKGYQPSLAFSIANQELDAHLAAED